MLRSRPLLRPQDADWTLGRIDLVKALSEASARARRREHASAYLREIGLRSATVIVDNGARKSIWRVPEFDLDLDHRRSRSSVAGRAKIESLAGPWEINFRTPRARQRQGRESGGVRARARAARSGPQLSTAGRP